jgi:hypothetical protein
LQAQLEFIGETDARAKNAKPNQLIDVRILEELDKSGFIDRLYKQKPSKSGTRSAANYIKIIEDVRSAATPPKCLFFRQVMERFACKIEPAVAAKLKQILLPK